MSLNTNTQSSHLTPTFSSSSRCRRWSNPTATMLAMIINEIADNCFPSRSMLRCSGVRGACNGGGSEGSVRGMCPYANPPPHLPHRIGSTIAEVAKFPTHRCARGAGSHKKASGQSLCVWWHGREEKRLHMHTKRLVENSW